jgi:predicted nucleic acid-binding protein
VVAEFSSALSLKLRTGQLAIADRATALTKFSQTVADTFLILPIFGSHFRDAARFADRHTLGLRASDALHIAICVNHGATLCSLDSGMNKAAEAVGVKTIRP